MNNNLINAEKTHKFAIQLYKLALASDDDLITALTILTIADYKNSLDEDTWTRAYMNSLIE